MLDMIIREAAAKFGLGDKGGMIVSALLGMMFKKESGGLAGFLDMFKQKGLADLASSWIGGGKGLPLGINPTQMENAIGGGLVKDLAAKTGLGSGPLGSAVGFMLPNIVHALTGDGKVPTGIPAAISQYMSGDKAGSGAVAGAAAAAGGAAVGAAVSAGKAALGGATGGAGAAAGRAAVVGGAADKAAAAVGSLAPGAAASGGIPKWVWLLIPAVLAIGWFMTRKPGEAPAPAAQAPKAAPAVEAPRPAPVVEAPKPTEAPAPAPVAEAPKDAAAQLDALKAAGNVSGDDLVKALNMTNIRFATGSAKITPESMDIVKKAAETIKAAAAGTKIEVGGHTDNVGNPASNMKLSDARAQSVMSALVGLGVGKGVLTAKGYGDSKPVASNDTTEGKAQNRRMEYSLVK
ncbi:MAG: OmpA family protein [Burkholderiales bacterium]